MTDKQRIEEFVKYAGKLDGDERSEAQVFLDRLFIGFGHAGHKEAGATLEARIRKANGATSFADLRWGDRVLIEMKKRGENLQKHYPQAFEYWINAVPSRPRYVVLCNFDEFWVYDLDTQVGEPVDRVALADLPARHEVLNFLFPDERPPLFGNDRVAVTRAAADKVASVFQSLIARKVPREEAQRFILQSVAAMFAEDIGLLPRHIFTRLVDDCIAGESSYDLIGGLFRQMNATKPAKGGRYLDVPYFNGGLFAVTDPLELDEKELHLLREAAAEDWSKVEPPVFGAIFQGSMDAEERHAYGAHFTSEADILRIIIPTIATPWRQRIEAAKTLAELVSLRNELSTVRVLDPACGSGNFLYIAYRELKRLEMEILRRAHSDFKTGFAKVKTGAAVHLQQFHGMDVTQFAVELAKVTLTIGKKLAIDEARRLLDTTQIDLDLEHEFEKALPLDNLDANILIQDALFTDWPDADVIVGNPPYQSKNKIQKEMGPKYVQALRARHPEVPGRADFCVYWFRIAHDNLKPGGRAGLVGTNTIRQNYSREGGLDYIVSHGGTITEAVSTQDWSGDAAVSVSIVNWIKGEQKGLKRLWIQYTERPGKPWRYEDLPTINSSLSFETDVAGAKALEANRTAPVCFQGQTHGHEGFLLDRVSMEKMLAADPANGAVIKAFLGADDLLSTAPPSPSRWVIDFQLRTVTQAAAYSAPFDQVRGLVLPDRKAAAEEEEERNKEVLSSNPDAKVNKHHANFLNKWWLLSYGREKLLAAIDVLPRYIVCSRVTKRPIFEFICSNIRPNDSLAVFALQDDYSFGVLQSRHHWDWFVAKCSTLTERYRYTSNTVFDTFPWPQEPTQKAVRAVADAAAALRAKRREIMTANGWSLRDAYASMETPGKHPLKDAHAALDAAVSTAYSMPKAASVLPFLLKLNLKLADAESKKGKVVGPGLEALGGNYSSKLASFVSADCVTAK